MRIFEHFQKGINIEHWISRTADPEHFHIFLTEENIKDIAKMKFDHIRLIVDYNIIQKKDGSLNKSSLNYVEDCIKWCKKHNLHAILVLHKNAGTVFDEHESSDALFIDFRLQERFIQLWSALSARLFSYQDILAFEISNQLIDQTKAKKWNELVKCCTVAIRHSAPSIKILIGGVQSNSLETIRLLEPPMDDNIVYSFHCYEPMMFSHQNTYWVKSMQSGLKISYPQTAKEAPKKSHKYDTFCPRPLFESNSIGQPFFEILFGEAVSMAEYYDIPLYCGEFGVIALADPEDALVWFTDITAIFKKYKIGYAMWNYQHKSIGITDGFIDVKDTLMKKII
ncbi:glycoside hydrolase family 5 protein [[Clostridium] polysaccharolyticum]|uniref:Aryl-phospho-beta-D-glucosidase BglC, GH1 family n=1 Tax=[Clostridium] polysaccharolyticum TaxID=29364 RepID=A0A1H9ZCH7_9FIRM|nr:cellulase family glycosylhydrolase [[Clostridium] polysaccharolyticum]SES79253.1 Aryl-phospho-beta-D-glucosidase BglC, GH1 family [[Clostridium] polysaccharolyticum]